MRGEDEFEVRGENDAARLRVRGVEGLFGAHWICCLEVGEEASGCGGGDAAAASNHEKQNPF